DTQSAEDECRYEETGIVLGNVAECEREPEKKKDDSGPQAAHRALAGIAPRLLQKLTAGRRLKEIHEFRSASEAVDHFQLHFSAVLRSPLPCTRDQPDNRDDHAECREHSDDWNPDEIRFHTASESPAMQDRTLIRSVDSLVNATSCKSGRPSSQS